MVGESASFNIFPYGHHEVMDFLGLQVVRDTDWIITNPPFRLAEKFAIKSLSLIATSLI